MIDTLLILIGGYDRVGKSTLARSLQTSLGDRATIQSFGGPVKQIARDSFGWDGHKDGRGRVLLRNIGKTGRVFDPHFWAKKAIDQIRSSPEPIIIFDDWRFYYDEYKFLEGIGFPIKTIRVYHQKIDSLPIDDDSWSGFTGVAAEDYTATWDNTYQEPPPTSDLLKKLSV